MTKSEQICKALGIEWHQVIPGSGYGDYGKCTCGATHSRQAWATKANKETWPKNPNFEGEKNDAGRVQLLRLMKEYLGEEEFEYFLVECNKDDIYTAINPDYLLTDGPLVDAVIKWFDTPTRKQLHDVAEKALEGWVGRGR